MIPNADGSYQVECRILDRKVGCFVAELSGDKILVKTFLLITMRGTPEGSELSRGLGSGTGRRVPALDHLVTLVRTDLGSDPEIVGLLRDCGCGGILDLTTLLCQESVLAGYATGFRDYLGRNLERCLGDRSPGTARLKDGPQEAGEPA